MAKEKSWFVGFTKVPLGRTADTAATMSEREGENVDFLADQVTTGASLGGIDPETEREPPKRPLNIAFPKVKTTPAVRWNDDHPPPDFQRLYGRLERPEAVLSEHLKAANCDHRRSSKADAFLPPRADGSSYLPYKCTDKLFTERLKEVKTDNDDAFRALSRTTRPGDKRPRLAQFRKFWSALDSMAQYWDTKEDEYYTVDIPAEPTSPDQETSTQKAERYKGRRTSNGHDMPDAYRANTVLAFVEGVTSAFNSRVSPPFIAPGRHTAVLQIGNVELPVRLTGVVMRLHSDPDKAKSRIMGGPVLGICERNTIDFGSSLSSKISWRKSEHDLLREFAAMMVLAQQRRREVQSPSTPGEGKWFTKAPRWGGGPGIAHPVLQKCQEEDAAMTALIAGSETVTREQKLQQSEVKRRLKKAQDAEERWKSLTCRTGLWDDKTDYKGIGRAPGSPYDEVSLLPNSLTLIDRKLTERRSS